MFAVIYSFKVKENKEADFISAWEQLTKLIYQYEGSLGSRLHKKSDIEFIAYAQWQSKEQWQNAGSNLPSEADEVRRKMKDACEHIETLHELEPVSDLLQSKIYKH